MKKILQWTVTCIIFAVTSGFAADPVLHVAAAPREIKFRWDPSIKGEVLLREFDLNEESSAPGRVLWTGSAELGGASVPRFEGAVDRLFAKFRLDGATVSTEIYEPQYVTDFNELPRRKNVLGDSSSKKGIACLLDDTDGIELGFKQVNQNIDIGGLLDLETASPKMSFVYEGRTIGLREGGVRSLDMSLKTARKNSQRVTGILLNNVTKKMSRDNALVHPLTDPEVVPIGPSAFNTATAEGVFYYRAIICWLVDRYTREDGEFGHLAGLVIGNEMQSHWSWYHLGSAESGVVIREYSAALRIADLATRSLHVNFPIYVSLDHHWALSASENPLHGFGGLEALEGINAIAKKGGNYPWNVAFHPYPENLMKPEFWKDQSAPLRLDAPRITFHNLEVLPAFLRQEGFLINGRTRKVALTEQGFNCPEGPEGETNQAAAFAFAWKKVQALPEVESFLYHRHVDHPFESGLKVGIREHDGSSNILGMGRKRRIWDVVKSAGTPGEEAAFAFALPVVGLTDWSDVICPQIEAARSPRKERFRVFYNFNSKLKEAISENVHVVQLCKTGSLDEVRETGILEHPKPKGEGFLKYNVSFPPSEIPLGGPLMLKFDALLNHAKSKGAGFRVQIDGTEVFSKVLGPMERIPVEVNVERWRGKSVPIVWIVDAAGDPSYDSAVWIEPALVIGAHKNAGAEE